MKPKTTTPPHHHGNLRQALIDAGIELLETGGPAALTLRKCAALAGVSHAAPANHFSGLISLKVAIVARGHLIFAQHMRQSKEAAEPDPHAQLNAICEGYIAFAQEHRALFQFMFQYFGDTLEQSDEIAAKEKGAAAEASYGILRAACAPFEHVNNEPLNTESMVWSLVHGYAMLFSGDGKSPPPEQHLPAFSDLLPTLTVRQDLS